MVSKIRFGPSGSSESFYLDGNKTTEQMPAWVEKKGLNAFEYSFGRGVNLGDEKAASICSALNGYDIAFSVHAPYFINFANPDDSKIQNSINYVLESARILKIIGGERVVFHPSSLGKMKRAEAVELTKKNIDRLANELVVNGYEDMIFCPETMGKHGQIGTTEEVVSFCRDIPFFIPCIDFGHVNSYSLGGLKNIDDYRRELDIIFEGVGEERAKNIHVHFSKIQYGNKGELRHLTLADTEFGPEFEPLAKLFHEYRMTPTVICESAGVQAEDAMTLKKIYFG